MAARYQPQPTNPEKRLVKCDLFLRLKALLLLKEIDYIYTKRNEPAYQHGRISKAC